MSLEGDIVVFILLNAASKQCCKLECPLHLHVFSFFLESNQKF